MKKIILAIIFSLFLTPTIHSQDYIPYNWNESRQLYETSEEEDSHALYQLYKNESFQFTYDKENDELVSYITVHEIFKVNNDEALQKRNRVYIPMYNTLELSDLKARTITKNGEVINFDENNIKELEEDEYGYKIFAIEGAELGGEIEYYYTRKTNASSFSRQYFQFDYPIKTYQFSLSTPDNLEYDFKVYNDLGRVVQTDTSSNFNKYEFEINNVPALYEEEFSEYINSKKRIEFKLAYNSANGKARINTWGTAGKRLYDVIYLLNDSETKELKKFMKKLNFTGTPIEVFKQYEHYVKTNFIFEEKVSDQEELINQIIKNKYSNSKGLTKLLTAILNELDIFHELVLTSDRFSEKFDPDFDTWNYLGEYLIYINEIKEFTCPKATSFRIGTIPSTYIETPALFIRPEQIQDYIYPVAHISFIPAPDYTSNFDNMEIIVGFNENKTGNNVKVKRSYNGYSAEYYKSALMFVDETDKKEMLEEVLKYLSEEGEISSVSVTEAKLDYKGWGEPFTVEGEFQTDSYIESASDIILFKAGELIGPQSELYQESERKFEVVNQFNHGYSRKISIDIPNGLTIKNPEDLNISKTVKDGSENIFIFESSYKLDGQKLEIEIEEFYNQIYFPMERFERFREVINAAADFNKVVLVLQK